MPQTTKIQANLEHLIATHFQGDGRKLIFWFDPEQNFGEDFAAVALAGFEKIQLHDHNQVTTKFYLETEGLDQDALIYCAYAQKPAKEDPLFDLVCQGQCFAADRMSLLMTELGLGDQGCREVLASAFFNSQQRLDKLRPLLTATMTAGDLQKAMLYSLAGIRDLRRPELLLVAVFSEGLERGPLLEEWHKFGMENVFWDLIRLTFGYGKSASLRELAVHLCISAWAAEGHGIPENRQTCVMAQPNQAALFIDHWQQDDPEAYRQFGQKVETVLQIKEALLEMTPAHWVHSRVFPCFERAVVEKVMQLQQKDAIDQAREWLEYRPQSQHLSTGLLKPAQIFFEALAEFNRDFQSEKLYASYAERHYRVDQAYREFFTCWDEQPQWPEEEHQLSRNIEQRYIQQFLPRCAQLWEQHLTAIGAWERWPTGLPKQRQEFFAQQMVASTRNVRTYVIISDALRYEVGKSLTEVLVRELRGEASCEPMLAVLPTYTKLGMAALLPMKKPGESLAYAAKDVVTVDGISSSDSEDRARVIQAFWPDATAVRYRDFIAMSNKEGRAWQKPYQTIYIYHDDIDKTGESNESQTFVAAKRTIADLVNLVQRITSLNASHIWITADHGFLFQRTKMDAVDKIKVVPPERDILGSSRRFYLGANLEPSPNCHLLDMGYLLGKDTPVKALIARGNQRISRQGPGANFVHGGASLQELMIPLIRYQHRKAGSSGSQRARQVPVHILFNGHIRSNSISVPLQQGEPLGEKHTERGLQVGIYDPETDALLSNLGTAVFNFHEKDAAARIHIVKLKGGRDLADRSKAELRLLSPDGEIYRRMICDVSIYFQDDFGV